MAILLNRACRSEAEAVEWRRLISNPADYPGRIVDAELLGLANLKVGRLLPAHPERFLERAYIQDEPMIPAIRMESDQDYGAALLRFYTQIQSGFLLLEWDIALGPESFQEMAAYVYSDSEAVWAAPYFLYYPSQSVTRPSQVPDVSEMGEDGLLPFVPLGCTYLPEWVLAKMKADGLQLSYPTPDHQFNQWASANRVRRRLAAHCRPTHLHYGDMFR